MNEKPVSIKGRDIKLECALPEKDVTLVSATFSERLSELSHGWIEFNVSDKSVELQKLIGQKMDLVLDPTGDAVYFYGMCVSAEIVDVSASNVVVRAETRPWLWLLTQNRHHRIFQEKSAKDIVSEIFGDWGLSDFEFKLSNTPVAREYCVQYGESDFDFFNRLMEEEGIYYFFDDTGGKQKLILTDSLSGHKETPNIDQMEYHPRDDTGYRRNKNHIFEWAHKRSFAHSKVALADYNFEKPTTELLERTEIKPGDYARADIEQYEYPGHFRDEELGKSFSRYKIEAGVAASVTQAGVSDIQGFRCGNLFEVVQHPTADFNGPHLCRGMAHYFLVEDTENLSGSSVIPDAKFKELFLSDGEVTNLDSYVAEFEALPKDKQFRAPVVTPWPKITGLQTALVTGMSGEEIHTDNFGRIKVQFHWDREGKKDEKTTCWVRCVMPWTGKSYGMQSIPRIGQEVVIQFEEGNPDRPICTGMLYNKDNMPPYALPANMTQTGIKTRSTKSGDDKTFNELVFEDKKDAEFVRLQSERDFTQIIKNDAVITIGVEKKKNGDLTQTIHRNKTETLKTGDHTFAVEEGKQTITIKKDHTETIEGKSTQTITRDTEQTVKIGNYKQTIKKGNLTRNVDVGTEKVTIAKGNYELKTTAGSIKITAGQKIELIVGANSIKIDNSGVTIKGTMVKVEASAKLDAKSPMTTIKGDGMLTLKGGMTMIN